MTEKDLALKDVFAARRRLNGRVVETPIRRSDWLESLAGAPVFLKLENLQATGSFKVRGALNALSWAKENGLERIFTASSGNHGLAVAEAARLTGCEATVCIPSGTAPAKRERLRKYNVSVIEHGADCEVTEAFARRLAREKNGLYVSPYNNREVMAGQATIAIELTEALPDLTTIVAAVGGGGLIGGIAAAAKTINPQVRIVGAVAANSPVMKECVQAGRIMPVFQDKTIADGIAGNIEADSITLPVVRQFVDEWVAVDEADIADTVFEFLDNEGMLIEGAAAVAVAAVSRRLIDASVGERVAVVVCGGNISADVWQDICFSRLAVAR